MCWTLRSAGAWGWVASLLRAPIPSHPILSCAILSHSISSHLVPSHPIPSYPVSSHPTPLPGPELILPSCEAQPCVSVAFLSPIGCLQSTEPWLSQRCRGHTGCRYRSCSAMAEGVTGRSWDPCTPWADSGAVQGPCRVTGMYLRPCPIHDVCVGAQPCSPAAPNSAGAF